MWEFLADEKSLLFSSDPRNGRTPPISRALGAIKTLLTTKPVKSMMKRR
jgi:hypothetical protein